MSASEVQLFWQRSWKGFSQSENLVNTFDAGQRCSVQILIPVLVKFWFYSASGFRDVYEQQMTLSNEAQVLTKLCFGTQIAKVNV